MMNITLIEVNKLRDQYINNPTPENLNRLAQASVLYTEKTKQFYNWFNDFKLFHF